MIQPSLERIIEETLNLDVISTEPLSGGCVSRVLKIHMSKGLLLVAKIDESRAGRLVVEAQMLRYLADNTSLPVPDVLYVDEQYLLLEWLPGNNVFSGIASEDAARLLADLHAVCSNRFGFEYDTAIGGLHQPNPWCDNWIEYFREHRLRYMARESFQAGRVSLGLLRRVEKFSQRLEQWIPEPDRGNLLHGDVWSGNVLANGDRITAFLDPAIYFGHYEVDIAFTTLFTTFEEPFYSCYEEQLPLDNGFWKDRRDIYNLYPLLVHVRLFGGSYVRSVGEILSRYGC